MHYERQTGAFVRHPFPVEMSRVTVAGDSRQISALRVPSAYLAKRKNPDRSENRLHARELIAIQAHIADDIKGADGVIAIFDPANETYFLLDYDFGEQAFVLSMCLDRGGVWWLGTNGQGLYKFDPQTARFPCPNYQTEGSLAEPSSSSRRFSMRGFLVDTLRNEVWLNKSYRLFRANRKTGLIKKAGRAGDHVWSMIQDLEGKLWIGGAFGLRRMDLQSGATHDHHPVAPAATLNDVLKVYRDKNDTLWCALKKAFARFERGSGRFYVYPFPQDFLRSELGNPQIYQDEKKLFWIGSKDGLICFDPEQEDFGRHYHNEPENPRSLSANWVTAIVPDPDQPQRYLWLGTTSGLNRFDRVAETFTAFTTEHGLPNNTIYGVLADNEGKLWMSTNKGISQFAPHTEKFRNFTTADGLQSNEFNFAAFYKSPEGEMFFGGIKGFNAFYPEDILDNPYIPPIALTDFQYYESSASEQSRSWRRLPTPAPELEAVALPYNANTLSFEFAALDYSAAGNNQYAYMLEGLNDEWIYCGTERRANFSLIPPGHYVFRVKGSNSDGIWNDVPQGGTSVKVIIHPPWWRTWWAYALYAILALTFLYSLRRYEMNRQQLKHNLELEHVHAEKLEELDHLKSRFFANISHEFRTPLTLILGPLENLRSGRFKSDLEKQYGIMERNARRLLRLINQLLDLSKLEAGKLTLQASCGNLIPFVKGIVYSFESLAERKKIILRFKADAKEIMLYFDRDKIEKIVTNLLSNAFKFTPEGGKVSVQLAVISEQSPANRLKTADCILMTVRDTGTGIPGDQLPNIFDRFFSSGESHSMDHPGSGIGLALTKELVELHHGEISVASEVGKGTIFSVRLPLGKDHLKEDEIVESVVSDCVSGRDAPLVTTRAKSGQGAGEPEAITAPIQESNDPSIHALASSNERPATSNQEIILIIEDNPDMRVYIREQLSDMFQVLEAGDGEEGFEKSVDKIPDLIISDVMMPKMDGYQFCEKLKSDERTSHIPVILLTAKSSGESKLEGLELGADDYLIKPFDSRELLARIKNLIAQRRKLRERFGKEIKLQPRDIAITSTDEKFLERAMAVVDEHISEAEFDVETFGRKVGMSRKHLHRKLKALTDQAPREFIRTLRLQRAARLLEKHAGWR